MALPVLALSVIVNFTSKLRSYLAGQVLGTAVTSDTDVDIAVIDTRSMNQTVVQINNSDGANGLVYTLYGTAAETVPPDFPTGPWEAISGASATLATGANKTVVITEGYSYVLVRAHRQTTNLSSHIDVYARIT